MLKYPTLLESLEPLLQNRSAPGLLGQLLLREGAIQRQLGQSFPGDRRSRSAWNFSFDTTRFERFRHAEIGTPLGQDMLGYTPMFLRTAENTGLARSQTYRLVGRGASERICSLNEY